MDTTVERPSPLAWPAEGLTRVPLWAYQDEAVFQREQQRIYHGNAWHFLCMELELPQPGDYITTQIGVFPVIVARDHDGELYAYRNRCAHKGSLLALSPKGNTRSFTCVYHGWSFDLQGDLKGVAFREGIGGQGGMPASFSMDEHNLEKLRVETFHGFIFGSFGEDTLPLEEYIGQDCMQHIRSVIHDKPVILGKFTQDMSNNWKLYVENTRDSYHASILHLFLTTFQINRLTQKGGLVIAPGGTAHVSYSIIDEEKSTAGNEYREQDLRSDDDGYRLEDESFLKVVRECPDGATLRLVSVLPGFAVGHVQNAFYVRQIVPTSVNTTRLNWYFIGFESDTEEMRELRLRQYNLIGTAGLVSMEDGVIGSFVQRGIVGSDEAAAAVVEMGGSGHESSSTRVSEAAVRAFWHAWRKEMEL